MMILMTLNVPVLFDEEVGENDQIGRSDEENGTDDVDDDDNDAGSMPSSKNQPHSSPKEAHIQMANQRHSFSNKGFCSSS